MVYFSFNFREGRARERAMLCKMRRGSECRHWWGSKKGAGRVGGRRGREIRRRARMRTRRSTAGTGSADLTGRSTAQWERKGVLGTTAQLLANRAREAERGGARGWRNRRRQVGPSGQGARTRESARERESPLTGGACLSGGAGARARGLAGLSWAGLGCFAFFLFSRFSNSFSISFL
jgi:hypothetical protein